MCIKGHYEKRVKWQPIDWEKIFANHIPDKGLISKIHKETLQLNDKKQPNKKWAKGLARHFSKADIPSEYMKICSTQLVIKEMHIKTTMRYHSPRTKMATIKTTENPKC